MEPTAAGAPPSVPRGICAVAVLMAASGGSLALAAIGYVMVWVGGDAHDSRVAGNLGFMFVLLAAVMGGFFAAGRGLRRRRRRGLALGMGALFVAGYVVWGALETGIWDSAPSAAAGAIFSPFAAFADMIFAGLTIFGFALAHAAAAEWLAGFFAAAHLAALFYLARPKTKALFGGGADKNRAPPAGAD